MMTAKKRISKKDIKTNLTAYLLIMPLILGLIMFTAYPLLSSFYYSFFDYETFSAPKNFGLQNYLAPFKTLAGVKVGRSVKVTTIYSAVMIPLNMLLSFFIALLINKNSKYNKILRLWYYLPVLIPTIISGLIWKFVFNDLYGISKILFPNTHFFLDPKLTLWTFMFTNIFGLGGGMLLWLAALKSVPETLYESAQIDGANAFYRTIKITLPICSPYIFYMLVTGIIGALQTFGGAYVIMGGSGGVDDSLLFYVLHIYNTAFKSFNVGYASALSYLLFIVIGILTFITFKTSKWVFYGEDS